MDPVTMAILVGTQVAGGIAGQQAAAKSAAKQQQILEQQYAAIMGIPLPDVQQMKLSSEQLISMGNFSPEEVKMMGELANSAYEGIQTDTRLQQDQNTALDLARERALKGFSAEDTALLDNYMRQASSQASSQAQTITQDAARRGMGGSGTALAAALQSSQGAANNMSQQALQGAAMRLQQQNQNADLLQRMASSMDQTQYNRQADLAGKRDSISEFNAKLRQDLERTNVGNRNQASLANLAEKQRVADANVALRNRDQAHNKALIQQDYDNALKRASAASGNFTSRANVEANRGAAEAEGIGKITSGASAFLTTLNKNEDEEKGKGDKLGGFLQK